MRPDMVVLFEPLIDDGLGLSGCCEPFCVEDFATQCSVKALIVSVRPKIAPLERFLYGLTPGATRINIDRLDAYFSEPVLKGLGCKLRAIIRAQIFRLTALE